MAKTTASKPDDKADAPRHPKEIAADLATMHADAEAQGLPLNVPAQLAVLREFAAIVAASYVD